MNFVPCTLAQVRPEADRSGQRIFDLLTSDLAVLCALALVLLLLLAFFTWLSFRFTGRDGGSRRNSVVPEVPTSTGSEDSRRHRRRRRRRTHRPSNPTLAETGGLPPRQSTDPAP